MLYHAHQTVEGFKLNLYGDSNQCDPVEGGSQIAHDYTTSISAYVRCAPI